MRIGGLSGLDTDNMIKKYDETLYYACRQNETKCSNCKMATGCI